MLEGVKPASGENINREDAIQSQILECSTRPTKFPQAEVHFSYVYATELVPMMMMMMMMILIYVLETS